MRDEQVKEFTRKITQCNRGGLIVVIYDIFFAYVKDAQNAFSQEEKEQFKESLRKAGNCIDELIRALDFKYAVSKNLYSLYVFAKESLAKSVIKNDLEDLNNAKMVMENLHEAFKEAAKQDFSQPLMRNTQQVYAGITYGRHDLTETYQVPEASRGFFA
ncbi:MAG: flagellar protein FliS [Roseburia sp.]|nr:flagellar protein FliS [Roseburia sp.]